VIERVREVLAAGGQVWVGDETTLREFPPLRAAWSRKGQQAKIVISGRNARRVIVGALNIVTGEVIRVVREQGRAADIAAGVEALGEPSPDVPRLLVWDNAPPHQARAARAAAQRLEIEIVKLPFRSPDLNPLEDLWRSLKAVVAANRVYDSVDELAERGVAYLDSLAPVDVLRLCGLRSSKFDWLPT
jgi:transposase